MNELRITTSLNRVKTFKNAVQKSGWYYSLIQRMINEEIHEKPLVKFMYDQIKNVIESGQIYDQY